MPSVVDSRVDWRRETVTSRFLLRPFALGDVAGDAVDGERFAVFERHAQGDFDHDAAAILGDECSLAGDDFAGGEFRLAQLSAVIVVFRCEHLVNRELFRLLEAVAQYAAGRWIEGCEPSFEVVRENHVAGAIKDFAILPLQRGFTLQPLPQAAGPLPGLAAQQRHPKNRDSGDERHYHHYRRRVLDRVVPGDYCHGWHSNLPAVGQRLPVPVRARRVRKQNTTAPDQDPQSDRSITHNDAHKQR